MKNDKNMKKIAALALCMGLAAGMLSGCSADSITFEGGSGSLSPAPQSAQAGSPDQSQGSASEAPETGAQSGQQSGSAKAPSASQPIQTASYDMNGVSVVPVTSGGSYTLSGEYKDQMILVDAEGQDVELVLDGADISCSNGPAIYVRAASDVTITLAAGSKSTLSDGSKYSIEDDGSTLDGCIFSKADLVISGSGSLEVSGNYKHGIVSKDTMTVESGSVSVTAVKTGIQGKDSVDMNGGSVTITAGTNGMASDVVISVNGGALDIKAKEGLEAETVNINDGDTNITASDDGINASASDSSSASGTVMMGGMQGQGGQADEQCAININGGKLTISSGGDGLDSNGVINLNGGEVYVDGPAGNGEQAVDWVRGCNVTGGTMIASGAAGMATNVTSSQGQGTVFVGASGSAGQEICLKDSSGKTVASFVPTKTFQCVLITSPSLEQGKSYTVTVGGTEAASFTLDSLTMNVGIAGGMGFRNHGMGFGQNGQQGKMPWMNGQLPSEGTEGTMPQLPGQNGTEGTRPQRPEMKDWSGQNDGISGATPQLPSEGAEGTMPQMPQMPGQNGTEGTRPQRPGSGSGTTKLPRFNTETQTF